MKQLNSPNSICGPSGSSGSSEKQRHLLSHVCSYGKVQDNTNVSTNYPLENKKVNGNGNGKTGNTLLTHEKIQSVNSHNQNSKIVHQLNNEGCQCQLCQKIVINEMKIIKKVQINDNQSEFANLRQKQQFLSKFLLQYFYIDKLYRKVRILLPQVCIFQKGNPVYLLSKKKQALPLKLIKNKQKLNAFQIQNFFMDGYIFHNNLKQNETIMKNHKVKTLSKQYYKFDEYLKNQCIVLVKFINGTNQMMTPIQLNNLFKSKQKNVRSAIQNITTMVCNNNYNEIRIRLNLQSIEKEQRLLKSSFTVSSLTLENIPLLERAKNEVKIINQHIKPKDFMYVAQKEEKQFQDSLKSKDEKKYLEYISMKMILLYSLRTGVLLNQSLFKFMKDQNQNYYVVDIQVYEKEMSAKLWGQFQKVSKTTKFLNSPQKKQKRPASSPQKLMQNRKTQNNEQTIFLDNKVKFYKEQEDIMKPITVTILNPINQINYTQREITSSNPLKLTSNNNIINPIYKNKNRDRGVSMKQIKKTIQDKSKSSSFFRLEPIKKAKNDLVSRMKDAQQNCLNAEVQKNKIVLLKNSLNSNINIIKRFQVKLL